MIQRIQTIYFALAAICAATPFFIPVYKVTAIATMNISLADAPFSVHGVAYIVSILLPLVAIFLYNNRPLQIRLGRLAMLVAVIALALLVIEYGDAAKKTEGISLVSIVPGAGMFIPIAGIVFAFLGVRAVKKDEALVRSADRIR